jgi:hypothetical protein
MLITKVYLAAMSRADVSEKVLRSLPQFYLYVDEFQSFANESFADILSEARKYKLNLTIAHQYIEQMSDEVRAAVFGNVGTMVVFRVGAYDAEVLEKEFAPQFTAEDIVNLGQFQFYLRLMIDSVGSQPFSARGLPPIAPPTVSYKDRAVESSRAQFAQIRSIVEEQVRKQTSGEETPAPAPSAGPNAGPRQALQTAPSERRTPSQAPSSFPPKDAPRFDAPRPAAPRPPAPRAERPAPPPDDSDGFGSIEAIKAAVTKPASNDASSQAAHSPRPSGQTLPPKKAGTAEARSDLRSALANLVGASQTAPAAAAVPTTPVAPKAAEQLKPEQQKPIEKPQQPKLQPQSQHQPVAQPKAEKKEVPEDVLKKMLEL